ncbi:hypothetical protein AB4182_00210 [Vibrio splendidus]
MTESEVIAIDGRTLRGTYNEDKRCGQFIWSVALVQNSKLCSVG